MPRSAPKTRSQPVSRARRLHPQAAPRTGRPRSRPARDRAPSLPPQECRTPAECSAANQRGREEVHGSGCAPRFVPTPRREASAIPVHCRCFVNQGSASSSMPGNESGIFSRPQSTESVVVRQAVPVDRLSISIGLRPGRSHTVEFLRGSTLRGRLCTRAPSRGVVARASAKPQSSKAEAPSCGTLARWPSFDSRAWHRASDACVSPCTTHVERGGRASDAAHRVKSSESP